jgi:hypothetical protein
MDAARIDGTAALTAPPRGLLSGERTMLEGSNRAGIVAGMGLLLMAAMYWAVRDWWLADPAALLALVVLGAIMRYE